MRWPWQKRAAPDLAPVPDPVVAEPAVLTAPTEPVEKAAPSKPIGTDGVSIFGGYLVSYERDPRLQAIRKWTTFDNLVLNTAIVASATRLWCDLGSGVNLRVEANPRGGKDAEKCADLVTDSLFRALLSKSMRSVMRRQLLKKMRGFTLHEMTWRRRSDGRIVLADLQHLPQWTIWQWMRPDPRLPWTAVVQQTHTGTSDPIPRERLLYSVEDTLTDAPDGVGLFRHLVELARIRDVYSRLEGIGYQTDLGGTPVGRAPIGKLREDAIAVLGPGADETEIAKYVTAQTQPLINLLQAHNKRDDQYLLLDSLPYMTKDERQTPTPIMQWSFDVVRSTMTAAPGIANAIMRLDREMARVLNAEHLLVGDSSGGTHNMHESKTEMMGLSIDSTLDDVCDDLTRDVAVRQVVLNGYDPETCAPTVKHDPVQTQSVKDACASLLMLAQAAFGPDDEAPDVMRGRMNLPPRPDPGPDAMLQRPTRPLPNIRPKPAALGAAKPAAVEASKPGEGEPGNPAAQPGATP